MATTETTQPTTIRFASLLTKLAMTLGLALVAVTMLSSYSPDTNPVTVPVASALLDVLILLVPGAALAWGFHFLTHEPVERTRVPVRK